VKIGILSLAFAWAPDPRALGERHSNLKLGHRGGNQPVGIWNPAGWITAQNHGFAVDRILPKDVVDRINLTTDCGRISHRPSLFLCPAYPEASVRTIPRLIRVSAYDRTNKPVGVEL
jgi:hypothetical protein